MRQILLAVILFGCLITTKAQTTKVAVEVYDEQHKPIDGLFTQLLKSKDSSMVRYAISSNDGHIEFDKIKPGSYYVFISQTGYENYYSSAITVDSTNPVLSLPDITLKTKELKEVTVVSNIPVIQRFADKTVVNVQQSVLTAASSIFDIIQRSPGIQVDQSDNISMIGKSGVTVMIDGKPTTMSGSDLANFLRGMPADAVDKIEFITNPSAKYDANGTGGIINIILKKDKRIGTNGTVSASYGQGFYAKSNDGFSFNSRGKNYNFFMNYYYSYSKNFHNAPRTRDFYNGDELTGGYSETDFHTIPFISNTGRVGADFFLSKNTTSGCIADLDDLSYNAKGSTTANVFDSLNRPVSYNITNSNVNHYVNNYSGNINLTHKFDSIGREIVLNVDYANFTSGTSETFVTGYYNLDNSVASNPYELYGNVPGQLNIYSFKADYDGQLGKNGILEAGVKSSYVKTDNNLLFYDGLNSSAPLDTTQSNHFIYSENINAAYASYSKSMGKMNVQLGLRAEQTIASGDQVTTGQTFNINNLKLFPNFDFNDSISKSSQLGLSISRRLDRPSYQQLNPFRNYVDPTTYGEGNPYLLPQYSYNFQLSETYKQDYSISLNYIRTTGVISEIWTPVPSIPEPIIAETEGNIADNDYYGISATVILHPFKWWTSTNNADAYYTHYEGNFMEAGINQTEFFWNGNSDNLLTFKNKMSLDINGYYNSGYDGGYLSEKQSWAVAAGIQKKILDNKGTIKLGMTDIFYTSNSHGTAMFTGYIENYYIKRDTRVVNVSFSYHFGSNSQSRSMRNKGGAEEEKRRAGGTS